MDSSTEINDALAMDIHNLFDPRVTHMGRAVCGVGATRFLYSVAGSVSNWSSYPFESIRNHSDIRQSPS